jgi:hypothetical protein
MKNIGSAYPNIEIKKTKGYAYLHIAIKKYQGGNHYFGGYHYLVLSLFFALCDFFRTKNIFCLLKAKAYYNEGVIK